MRVEADQLTDRHAVVTGGGSGVGAAVALALAETGAQVTVMGRRAEPLKALAARHPCIGWQSCDVTDADAVQQAFSAARDERGPVAVMVANAGAAPSRPFARMSAADFTQALSVNLAGVFNCWQAALGDMQETGWGRMIAIASSAGLKGYPYVSGYVAAKHGVVGLTRALALELAREGITVNALCPGFTDTPLLERSIETIMQKTGMERAKAEASLRRANPQDRFIQPGEIAEAVLFLCSDAARGVNGAALPITGGEI